MAAIDLKTKLPPPADEPEKMPSGFWFLQVIQSYQLSHHPQQPADAAAFARRASSWIKQLGGPAKSYFL